MNGFPMKMGLSVSSLGLAVLSAAVGCGSTKDDGNTGGSASGGTGGVSVDPGTGGAPVAACALTFSFTTLDNSGRYSPRNVSAVWVVDAQGQFIKTLEENGHIRQGHLTSWVQASGGSVVDAITGATNAEPRVHEATWDCTDLTHAPAPAGSYTMNAEFATDNGGFLGKPAPLLQVPFEVGSGEQIITPPNAPFFTDVRLTIQ